MTSCGMTKPPPTADDIKRLAQQAGLDLPAEFLPELIEAYGHVRQMAERLSAPRPREQSGDGFEIGNLAALEDDPLSGRVRRSSAPPSSSDDSEPPPVSSRQPPPQLSSLEPEPMPNMKGSGKGGTVAALIVFALLAAGAGAYFGGLIPH